MEMQKTAPYFWNDWIIGAVALCIGIAFWFGTRRPSALVVAIGTIFMFLSTVMGAVFGSTLKGDPMTYFYGGASEAVGLLGAGLMVIGVVWYTMQDHRAVQARILELKKRGSIAS
jgi:hypothetical protein